MPGFHGLTVRQREIARLVADGLSNPEIADRLCIERSTVESHIHNILVALGFGSRVEIATWLVREQFHDVMDAPHRPGEGLS